MPVNHPQPRPREGKPSTSAPEAPAAPTRRMDSTFHISQRTPRNKQKPSVSVLTREINIPSLSTFKATETDEPPKPLVTCAEVESAVMVKSGTVHNFKEVMRSSKQLAEVMSKAIKKRNEKANAKYLGSRVKEEAEVAEAERQIAEAEAILRSRREKISVRKAEMNAVLENLKREENENIARTKKLEARRKEARRILEEERIYGMVYGGCFIDHLKVDSTTTLGRCYCPEGKIIASIDKREEQCNFWDCPALKPKSEFLPPKPLPRSRHPAPSTSTRPPVFRPPPPPVQRIETTVFSEPTGELFPESEPTADLFPETLGPNNFYGQIDSEPTGELFPST